MRYVVRRRVLRLEGTGTGPLADPEINALVDEVVEWIGRNLTLGYAWPGNFPELEQCVRNLMIRHDYRPSRAGEEEGEGGGVEALLREVRGGA